MTRSTKNVKRLIPLPLTDETFRPFGQIIRASEDGKAFDQDDAQLVLDRGIPRFYIMRLPPRGLSFHRITYHARCTQCLGSLQGKSWYIGVAPASLPLNLDQIVAFKIPGDCFIKLELGTWHAGPLFQEYAFIDFYNLELSDTNTVDHTTLDILETYNLEFTILAGQVDS